MVAANNLVSGLNSSQQEAVTLGWGPALVVAGAGSGKTTVLTRRVAYLVTHLAEDPSSVLGVTFTNKAAGEMRQRLDALVGHDTARRLSIGTFHSTCARLLRRDIESYRSPDGLVWKSNFVIYDEADSLNVVKAAIARLNLDDRAFAPREVMSRISSLKNDGCSAARYGRQPLNYRDERISQVFSCYQSELSRNNALDFDDLILVFTDLLRQNELVRKRYQEQFRHILVDEFQDTNHSQYEFIRLLAVPGQEPHDWRGRSLMVVGDVDQSIYSWRKADFRIILGFQNDFKDSRLIKLEENYRSTRTILEVANSVIVNNAERIEKVLRCNRGQGAKAQVFAAIDEVDEAYCVVEELKRLSARGKALSDCVFLYRTNAQSRALEEVLVRSNIPYTMVGSTRFYDRAEVKDVLAYLKLIYNGADGQSFMRMVNKPRRGLGKTTLERLAVLADERGQSLLEAANAAGGAPEISGRAARSLCEFASMVARWQMLSRAVSVSTLIEVVMSESRYLAELEAEAASGGDPQAYSRLENVRELIVVAREFEELGGEASLESFLTRVSLVSDLDLANLNEDAVKLMTLHSAKGLEFPVVFLMGLEEGLFPHIRSLNLPQALEEERRLMYVGITRAQDLLYLSYARRRMLFGGGSSGSTSYTIPSRFLNEISPDLLVGYYPEPESVRNADGPRQDAWAGPRPARRQGGYSGNRDTGGGDRFGFERAGFDRSERLPGFMKAEPAARPKVIRTGERVSSPGGGHERAASGSPPPDFQRLAPGDVVRHGKFGVGKVVQVIGDRDKELYNVDFEAAGKRLLDPRFAKLVKLN